MKIGRLDRYVAGHFLSSWVIWLFFMVGLMIIFDLFGNMDKFAESARELPDESILLAVIKYYLVNSVFVFLQLVPFITVTSAMFTVAKLMKCNEIVPMIVTGTSVYRILIPLFIGATLAAGAMIVLREAALPTLRPLKERLHQIAFKGEREKIKDNLFFTDPAGRLVAVDRYFALSKKVLGLNIVALGRMSDDLVRYTAAEAVWGEKDGRRGWLLTKGGSRMEEDAAGALVITQDDFLEPDGLTPDFFSKEIKKSREFFDFSYSELAELARLRPDYKNYQVLLHYHVTFPLANIVLLLLTLPFGFRFERKSTLEGVIFAIFICGLYIVLDISLRNLGGVRALHPIVAAWIIPVLFGSAGVVLFGSMRT